MMMLGLPATVLAVVLTAAPTPMPTPAARPPSTEEQKAFSDGLRLFDAGDAQGAERVWKAGYAVARDPAFLVRIGEAQEKAGAPRDAARSYEQYLRESPDAADRSDIEARVRRLAPPALGRPGAAAGAVPAEEAPGEMSPPGTAPATSIPGPGPSPPRRPLDAQLKDDDDANEDLRPLIEEERPRSRLNIAGWVGAGVTVLVLGVAAFYGAKASEKASDANRLLLYTDELTNVPQEYGPRAREYEALVRDGRHDDSMAKGLLIAAAATAVASAVLFIIDGSRGDGRDAATSTARADAGGKGPRRPMLTIAPTVPRAGTNSTRTSVLDLALGLAWTF